jgi:hypothetical protein
VEKKPKKKKNDECPMVACRVKGEEQSQRVGQQGVHNKIEGDAPPQLMRWTKGDEGTTQRCSQRVILAVYTNQRPGSEGRTSSMYIDSEHAASLINQMNVEPAQCGEHPPLLFRTCTNIQKAMGIKRWSIEATTHSTLFRVKQLDFIEFKSKHQRLL